MDKGVEEDKHPDGCRHVADASPHGHHGTGVVVGLKGRAELALGEDDEGVDDLVELAKVEDPTVEGKALVPEAARDVAARYTAGIEKRGARGRVPEAGGLVVRDIVAEASSAMELAERVHGASPAVGAGRADDTAAEDLEGTVPGPGRVDGEEDVVGDDKGAEGAGLADGPGPLVGRLVVEVESLGRDGIDGGDGQRHLGVKGGCEPGIGDGKWDVVARRRDGHGVGRRRQLEERGIGRAGKEIWLGHCEMSWGRVTIGQMMRVGGGGDFPSR